MSDDRRDVIGSLPSTRPHRRSSRRTSTPDAPVAASDADRPPATPDVAPDTPSTRGPALAPPTPVRDPAPPAAGHPGMVETLVQAAAEITEISLRASARAVRGAVSRLPRP